MGDMRTRHIKRKFATLYVFVHYEHNRKNMAKGNNAQQKNKKKPKKVVAK